MRKTKRNVSGPICGSLKNVLKAFEEKKIEEKERFFKGWINSEGSFLSDSQLEALKSRKYVCRQKADKKNYKFYVNNGGIILAKNVNDQSLQDLRRSLESLGFQESTD